MEKTNSCILLFLVFLTSICNSNYYEYDNYEYDEYYPEDYTADYSQELNDYYDQNLLAPPNPPPLPPIPPPVTPPPMSKITFFSILNMMKYKLFMVKSKQIKLCLHIQIIVFQSIANGLLGVNGAHALNLVELDKSRNLDRS